MPDAMDVVQQLAADHAEDALRRHQSRPVVAGRRTCANLDCAEPIAPARTALGAQLCLACQKADEAQAAHFDRWRRR